MKLVLVGGAVRDKLLGKKPKDLDYVALNTTEEELLGLGYKKISSDFPVFQKSENPDIQVSLPRKDYKIGSGYTGFKVSTENVSLEEDLLRRDFTINAMALDEENDQIIDPYHGQEDLKNKVIKHVGDHFSEDPLRMLRAARFAARLNFSIHEETKSLILEMINKGMFSEIKPDRFFAEFNKSIAEGYGSEFVFHLSELQLLDLLFPEITVSEELLSNLKKTKDLNVFFATLLNSISIEELKLGYFKHIPKTILDNVSKFKFFEEDITKYQSLSLEERYKFCKGFGKNRKSLFFVLKSFKVKKPLTEFKTIIKDWKIYRYSSFDIPEGISGKAVGDFYKSQIILKMGSMTLK